MRNPFLGVWFCLAFGAACTTGHQEPDDDGNQGQGASNGAGAADGVGADGVGAGDSGTGTGGLLPIPDETGPIGNGMPEVCDGTDTNEDGVIDNLDRDGDGVCDCLRLATLGAPGEWGEGDVFEEWLESRSDNGATHLGDQEITVELLQGFQVVVAQDLRGRTYTQAEVDALNTWIEGGGGLMTLIGYGDSSERTNINQLLEPTGLSYGEQGILSGGGGTTYPVTTWHEHPTTDGVTAIGTDNGYPVLGEGTVIAEEAGHVVAQAVVRADGRVFVWGDEWITYNSEWSGDNADLYQVELFWLNVVKWLTPANECQVPIPPTVR